MWGTVKQAVPCCTKGNKISTRFTEQSDRLESKNAEAEQKPQPPYSSKIYVGRAHDLSFPVSLCEIVGVQPTKDKLTMRPQVAMLIHVCPMRL